MLLGVIQDLEDQLDDGWSPVVAAEMKIAGRPRAQALAQSSYVQSGRRDSESISDHEIYLYMISYHIDCFEVD